MGDPLKVKEAPGQSSTECSGDVVAAFAPVNMMDKTSYTQAISYVVHYQADLYILEGRGTHA